MTMLEGLKFKMVFKKHALKGVFIIKPKILYDDRGYFFESFKEDVFKENNEVVYSRVLFYKYGVGRVAVYDDYGSLTLEKIIDLKTFHSLQKNNE